MAKEDRIGSIKSRLHLPSSLKCEHFTQDSLLLPEEVVDDVNSCSSLGLYWLQLAATFLSCSLLSIVLTPFLDILSQETINIQK